MAIHKGENPYIYGLHDRGGERLLLESEEPKGWVLVTEAIGAEAHERGGGDYRAITDKGLGLIVRLNQSYGENGTIPREARYPEFAQRVANFVEDSQGANIWLIGNEMNFSREQPRREGSNEPEPITPRRYATCYKMCRDAIHRVQGHEQDLVVVGAMAPWNPQTTYQADPQGAYPANPTGDWIDYMRHILLAIGPENCDAIAIHAYSHGYDPELVFSEARLGNPTFNHRYFNFFTYKDQMRAIPQDMRHLPVYLTEANGDKEPNGDTWPFGNNGWIKNAYQEINNWNTQPGNQQIRCVILFRWQIDSLGWSIDGKPEVQQDFKEAISRNYQWSPVVRPVPAVPRPEAGMATTPQVPPYRTDFRRHTTPRTATAGQNLTVNLTIRNSGSFTWTRDGARPFQLGFRWFDSQGQMVRLPSNLDFRTPLPKDVQANMSVNLQARLRTPEAPGRYRLQWDMVHEQVTWFSTQGDAGLVIDGIAINPVVQPVPIPTTPEPTTPAATELVPSIQIQDVSASLPTNPAIPTYQRRNRRSIRRFIVHHTATGPNVSVQRIAAFQVQNRNKPGISYHFCITDKGEVFQTQPLETISTHAGQHSANSVGVCLIGNFTAAPPPAAQLNATAALLAQIANQLQRTLNGNIVLGYSELVNTQSPGATWAGWKNSLVSQARDIQSGRIAVAPAPTPVTPTPTPAATPKIIEHYMLFWHRAPGNWAEWDLVSAIDYMGQFRPTAGFSIGEAKSAKYVTIVGGPAGVPGSAEETLRAAGCQVERLNGRTQEETNQMLYDLVARNRRFRTLR